MEIAKVKTIYVTLIKRENFIVLIVCDKNGKINHFGHILRIKEDRGKLYRFIRIDENTGLPLDSEGRIIFSITDKGNINHAD